VDKERDIVEIREIDIRFKDSKIQRFRIQGFDDSRIR